MVNQFVITKRLNGTEECVQYFQRSTRVFRERWLRKKNFASEKHAYKRSKPRAATKLTGDFAIFFNIRWSHKVFFSEKSYSGGHLKAILAGKGGDLKRTNLMLFDWGFRIKVLQRRFHFVFYWRFLHNYRRMQEPENSIHILAWSFCGDCILLYVT